MSVTDPISDFLLRIRNASKAKKLRVEIPASQIEGSGAKGRLHRQGESLAGKTGAG